MPLHTGRLPIAELESLDRSRLAGRSFVLVSFEEPFLRVDVLAAMAER